MSSRGQPPPPPPPAGGNEPRIRMGLPYLLHFFKPTALEEILAQCEAYVMCNDISSALVILEQVCSDLETAKLMCSQSFSRVVCTQLITSFKTKMAALRSLQRYKVAGEAKPLNFMEYPPKEPPIPTTFLEQSPPPRTKRER